MKTKICALTLGLMISTQTFAQTDKPDSKPHLIGLGSGFALGAAIGGPVGGMLGGLFGLFLADDVVDEKALSMAKVQLSEQNKQLTDMQQEIAMIKAKNQLQLVSLDQAVERVSDDLESNIQFRTGSYVIEPHYHAQLELLAKSLRNNPKLQLSLSGHADRRGDPSFNQALSEQRVLSVKHYLVELGVAEKQLVSASYGEDEPLKNEQNLENDFFDRRVMLQLSEAKAVMTAAN